MSRDRQSDSVEVGYAKPPVHSRFREGQSGNPKGRPRGSRNAKAPHHFLFGQLVTIHENGVPRRVTRAYAFLASMTKQGLGTGGAAARDALSALEKLDASRPTQVTPPTFNIIFSSSHVNSTLMFLRMGRKLDRLRPTARMKLEPWLVEAALARLGDRQLSLEQQVIVKQATRTPDKVKWPGWWNRGGERLSS